jgi:hypothetical protein
MANGTPWTYKEEKQLKKYWAQIPTPELAKKLNRTPRAIRAKAWYMGLPFLSRVIKKEPEWHTPESITDISENTRSPLARIIMNQKRAGFIQGEDGK